MLRPLYPIITRRLLLRPFGGLDVKAVHAINARTDVTSYLNWAPCRYAEVREVVQSRAADVAILAEGDKLVLAMVRRETGELVGEAILIWLSRPHRQGEIGFIVHPDHHGRGLAAEAALAMIQLGFESLGLHRIISRCDARNIASARLMKRLGMRREAHLRQNEFVKGEWCDEQVYAMLAAEWALLGPFVTGSLEIATSLSRPHAIEMLAVSQCSSHFQACEGRICLRRPWPG